MSAFTRWAICSLLCVIFLGDVLSVPAIVAVVLMLIGVLGVGILENRGETVRKKVLGKKMAIIAFCMPFVYALLDAVGGAIHHIGNVHKYAREEDRPEKTLFIITTDGMENSSRSYNYEKVKKMVERQKEKYGWEFLFLGANIDAIAEAKRFGIAPERAVRYQCDEQGTAVNFKALGRVISKVRACSAARMEEELSADWKKEIEADFRKRGQ